MRLHVIGSSAAVPRPGRANSCYVVEGAGAAIVLDCGSGAFARLREAFDVSKLSAVVITHMHTDHFMDLIALRYALKYEYSRAARLPVYLHVGARSVLDEVVAPLTAGSGFFDDVFELREYREGEHVQIDGALVRFAKTTHYIPAFAVRVEAGGIHVTFSSDTAPCEPVVQLAHRSEIFLCEAALGPDGGDHKTRGHSNAIEAGRMAADAGARHLVLTHYDAKAHPDALREKAASTFVGKISIADDGIVFET